MRILMFSKIELKSPSGGCRARDLPTNAVSDARENRRRASSACAYSNQELLEADEGADLAMAIQMLQTKRTSKGLSGWTYADATRTEGADWGRGIDAGMVSYEWCLVAAVILLCRPLAAAPRYEIHWYLSCS
jgi:hypothetical protein